MSAASRVDALARQHPEWTPWLRVVKVVTAELPDAAWDSGEPVTAPPTDRAPLLAGAMLRPDSMAVTRLLHRLMSVARAEGLHLLVGESAAARETQTDVALALFLAAVNGDDAALDAQAARTGASPRGVRTLARLLPMPYLHACARRWAADAAPSWTHGYCPVCGAWPAFAEVLGIERTRHLRCARCGAGWPMPALACTYCGTTDHERLAAWVADDRTARFAIDACSDCSGYLKSHATLQATPSDELLVADLESVAFDLAAVERDLARPPELAVALQATLEASVPS